MTSEEEYVYIYTRYNFGRQKIDWYVLQSDQDAIEHTQKYQHLKER